MVKNLRDVVGVLGGPEALEAGRIRSFFDFDRVIREGIPVRAFRHAVAELGGSESAVATAIGIPRTTLHRRKATGRLGFAESERVVRLGVIAALGKQVFGSTAAAGRWLGRPNRALGGRIPLELLRTDVGGRQVEAVLGRALFGGYS
jgi:putative toxin-antitoxin system antitoxin component (TIGR02293 family)